LIKLWVVCTVNKATFMTSTGMLILASGPPSSASRTWTVWLLGWTPEELTALQTAKHSLFPFLFLFLFPFPFPFLLTPSTLSSACLDVTLHPPQYSVPSKDIKVHGPCHRLVNARNTIRPPRTGPRPRPHKQAHSNTTATEPTLPLRSTSHRLHRSVHLSVSCYCG
jgi:hypothetical protein